MKLTNDNGFDIGEVAISREDEMNVEHMDTAIAAEEQLGNQLRNHLGEWVAVREHQVVGHAPTFGGLLEQFSKHEEAEEPEVFKVPEQEYIACFY